VDEEAEDYQDGRESRAKGQVAAGYPLNDPCAPGCEYNGGGPDGVGDDCSPWVPSNCGDKPNFSTSVNQPVPAAT
jgi:hypothetical protein